MKMNLIGKMEKLFAIASPKLLLDHYWEVLDLIDWRIFVGSEDKNISHSLT